MCECLHHTLVTRAGDGVGEGRVSECDDQRVEEGGGLRGCEVSRRSVRGYEAAVCVHVDTQSSRPDDTDHNKKKDRKVLM